MSCFLVALSAWLALQAGMRRRRVTLVAASLFTLMLACATAFSFAIMIPAVVAFAFFVWVDTMGLRSAWWNTAGLLAGAIALPAAIFTALHLWTDIISTTITRSAAGLGAGVASVARSAWSWDGLLLALAGVGVVVAFGRERTWSTKLLLLTLVGAALLVPVYQAHLGTGYSMDKHMSAGTWFLAMAAGYGLANMIATARWKPLSAALIAVAFFAFPAITGLLYAITVFHLWPNSSTLVARVEQLLRRATRPILVSGSPGGPAYILENAVPQGLDWTRWSTSSSPTALRAGQFGIVVMELTSTINSALLPRETVSGDVRNLPAEILALSANNASLLAMVRGTVQSKHYQLQYVIPFTTSDPGKRSGLFAIWKHVG